MNLAVPKNISSPKTRGFTLIELIVATAILVILTGMALPLARVTIKREREHELRRDLWEVRDAIDRYQPLLSLHGHIHESKGTITLGKTLSINPGSAYEEGMLMAAIINLDAKKGIKSYQLVNG